MARRDTLPKSDQRRIVFIGLGFVALSYLLDGIIDASVNGETVYRQIFLPGSREIAVRLAFLSVLFLFVAYVLNLLLKRRRLEEALEKYQAGMDASIDGIAILNTNRECVYVNSSHAKLHGYASHTELMGKSWSFFYGDDEIRRFEEEIFPVIFKKGEWRGEAVGRKRHGSVFPQEISLSKMDGKGIVCIVRDITNHKDFEEELERKARELSVTNRELESFSYSLTHDMRNYLTRSSSAAQILRESYHATLDESGRYLVKIIDEANQDMEELVNDMLVLSRLIQREIRREMVDLSEMVRSIAADLLLTEPERVVDFVIAPELVAECDSHLLKIAIENLLGNALKYTRKVPDTRVEFGVVEHNGKKAFFIRDNGMGFEMKDADQLFKPFQRLQNAKEFPGTGIGLATVQRIIQRHGGETWGEGEPGRGATFYFTLQV
ncbi:ATP-binding protein [Geobacter sp. AOG1]|uniref:sensor histidine kinase n=1 Tax=Geobacter sp. AOG1 TaxID=1566346 RepID=UPI001CC4D87B|nr:ATP-binding protein [Geobacter sp. AOG1]GFE56263.1 sensor histidine kinase [Geobacter sp. AOG1]